MANFSCIVSGIVLNEEDQALIIKNPAPKPDEGEWKLCGGEIDHNESPKHALVRHLSEKLGIKITADYIFHARTENNEEIKLSYVCSYKSGDIQNAEFKWIKWEDLNQYTFGKSLKIDIDLFLEVYAG